MRVLRFDGKRADGQGDVLLGLLDRMSDDGRAALDVRTAGGVERSLVIEVADAAERRRMTEPELLLSGLGFAFWRPMLPAVIGAVLPDGPAAAAGMQAGDKVLAVNGTAVNDFEDLRRRIETHAGDSVLVNLQRGEAALSLRIAVTSEEVDGRKVGRIGIGSARTANYPPSMLRHTKVGPFPPSSWARWKPGT